jgi:hypothetical protein
MAELRSLSPEARARVAEESSLNHYRFLTNLRRPDGRVVREDIRRPTDTASIIEILQRFGVRFVIIGGTAASVQGSTIVTWGFDVCYARDDENLERLAVALREMQASLRGSPPGLPFQLDARTLKAGDSFTFTTRFGDFDILGTPSGSQGFEQIMANAEELNLGGTPVWVASVSDLLRMKKAAGRKMDAPYIEQLGALLEEIDREHLDD